MREVDALEQFHHLVATRQHGRDRKGPIVRRAEHDQSSPSNQVRGLHRIPQLRMAPDKVARHESAHRVRDQVNRLAWKLLPDERREPVGRFIDVLAPVVGVGFHIPARAQRQHAMRIVFLIDAGDLHGELGIGFAPCRGV